MIIYYRCFSRGVNGDDDDTDDDEEERDESRPNQFSELALVGSEKHEYKWLHDDGAKQKLSRAIVSYHFLWFLRLHARMLTTDNATRNERKQKKERKKRE